MAWVGSFCNGLKASVVVGDYRSPISDINKHAGIHQGSLPPPILYVFYNANLVQGRINKSERSIDFIDEYNARVVVSSSRKVGMGEWCGLRGRQDHLHPLRSPAANSSRTDELFGVWQQYHGTKARCEDLGGQTRLGVLYEPTHAEGCGKSNQQVQRHCRSSETMRNSK